MKLAFFILYFTIQPFGFSLKAQQPFAAENYNHVVYFGDTISFITPQTIYTAVDIDEENIKSFYNEICKKDYSSVIKTLVNYKTENQLDDSLFYQLIRRVAQEISPKLSNYNNYTLYKWFLLVKCGYDAKLAFVKNKLLFYVQSNDNIYDIPLFKLDDKQYVCLNSHDFEKIDFEKNQLKKVNINIKNASNVFTYKIKSIPRFKAPASETKELVFVYKDTERKLNVTLDYNTGVAFNNYPSVDFESYFNIPLSKPAYTSLIPQLKKSMLKMTELEGIDYLMQFTRNAFMFETDQKNFGIEKRLSPELTLMNKYSDCDDRAALFYYLVKEMYDLPMIILVFPSHIAVAVAFEEPVGFAINYNGKKYSVCEPTPQKLQLSVGQLMPELYASAYEVAFAYT
ncbi:MAG: hypothetical protein LH615_06875, partial [Ferruginibacter sp.]|nr:hypothetical protein [Ferruginibacter sp.]